MKKSTLADALSVNQKLLDLAEKASGDEKKEIEKARETFCDLIVHLSGGIIQMSDAMDKQNDTIKQLNDTIEKYQKALELAAHDLSGAYYNHKQFSSNDCKEGCPCWSCCGVPESDSGVYECVKNIISVWKDRAGIGVIDPARIIKE